MSFMIRLLGEADMPDFRVLRLQSLQAHPSAYGSSFEDWEKLTDADLIQRILAPNIASFGAFEAGKLVGINGLMRDTLRKSQHRATIVAMYTLPEWRGRGVGKLLMQSALAHALAWEGLEDVNLAVTVGNESAKHLYENLGFRVYSRDPRLFKIDNQYFDVEWMILSLKEYKPE